MTSDLTQSAYIKTVTDDSSDLSKIVDNLIRGFAVPDQIETLLEVGAILEERKAMTQVLSGLVRKGIYGNYGKDDEEQES